MIFFNLSQIVSRVPIERLFLVLLIAFFLCPSFSIYLIFFYLVFLPYGFMYWWRQRSHWHNSPALIATYALLGYGVCRLFPALGENTFWCLELLKMTVLTLSFFLIAVAFFQDREHSADFWKMSLPVIACGATATLLRYFLFHQGERLAPIAQAHHPILGASVYGLFGLFALRQGLQSHNRKHTVCYFLLTMGIVVLVFFTQSKGPIIAVSITYLLLTTFHLQARGRLVLLLVALSALALYCNLYFYVDKSTQAPAYIKQIEERGLSFRPQIWAYTLQEIKQNPLWGHGMAEKFSLEITPEIIIGHPHNLYLATLYYLGAAGLSLEIAMIGFAYWGIVHDPNKEWRKFATLLLFYVLLSMVSDIARLVTNPKEVLLLFWLPFSWLVARGNNNKTRNDADAAHIS